ncbi:PREDICTED: pentatricopeptide repeat-containing protein At2g01390-like [Camelina sativa]|uniref:Pentatricopeptide repeat-containing protein At2g01390-like n=1 Tax=Camelina sativa TaxID=90675 RepID=A0ABM0ZCL3_CAMSA|nr:PREDICTED: pentatricopeptide repeat-containing protein At2g01390-like [Camelina sativa]XP_010513858.1 PREDICTED: pentatricopeptide repeat-containing protein At2g01390-like [Camelina sativa]XP_010513860.1 PREDICTED: pentatricopeptide repeat-containing protein At2g01390-like [Camelina sativa]
MRFSTIFRNHTIQFSNRRRSSVKLLHSLPRPRPRNPSNSKRSFQKPKLAKTQTPEDPRVYTRDVVSNIYNILKYSTWESAREQLPHLGLRWDSHIINRVLKAHPPMQKAWLFFNWASQIKGFKHDHFTYTTMLDIFGEAGRIQSMFSVFHLMKEKGVLIDTVTYTSLIHWVSSSGDVDGAMRLWEEMRDNGCEPTVVSYTAYMKILFADGRVEEATEVYKDMLRSRVSPNCHTYTVLMEFLVGTGKCEEALDIFFKMQEIGVQPDKAACNILIAKACKFREISFIARILLHMKQNGIVLRYPIFLEALETLKAAGESDDLLRDVNSHISAEFLCSSDIDETPTAEVDDTKSSNDSRVISSVLLMKQNLVAVDLILNQMRYRNIKLDSFVVSAIVETNCSRCRTEGASLALDYSSEMGIHLEKSAYLALIGHFLRVNELPKVIEVVNEMLKAQHYLGVYQGAMLIHRLGFGRRPRLAAEVFDLLPDDQKGVAAYTALMDVYISAGSPEKAMKILGEMREREIMPSLGTYNVLLSGLEKTSDFPRETALLRKEKKSLAASARFRENVHVEDNIVCDLLFATNL